VLRRHGAQSLRAHQPLVLVSGHGELKGLPEEIKEESLRSVLRAVPLDGTAPCWLEGTAPCLQA